MDGEQSVRRARVRIREHHRPYQLPPYGSGEGPQPLGAVSVVDAEEVRGGLGGDERVGVPSEPALCVAVGTGRDAYLRVQVVAGV